jgi:hypothetical protein
MVISPQRAKIEIQGNVGFTIAHRKAPKSDVTKVDFYT